MVNDRGYEAYQLALIVEQYRPRGFNVRHDMSSAASNVRYDAVLHNERTGQTVIVELVHSQMSAAELKRREDALRNAAADYPDALVDFRYIDVAAIPLWRLRNRGEDIAAPPRALQAALKQRVPALAAPAFASHQLLLFWGRHAHVLRAYALHEQKENADSQEILALYNALLRSGHLIAPEELVDGLELNLFQLHDRVLEAVQGAQVPRDAVRAMRQHVESIRKQIRKRLKSTAVVQA